jgi:hypothetical protein
VREIIIGGTIEPFCTRCAGIRHRPEENPEKLIRLNPKTFAAMHGASFAGNGAIRDPGIILR